MEQYFKKIPVKKPEVLIFEQIMDLIYLGLLNIGDQLPSVNALQERFKVGAHHINKAIDKLLNLGLISRIPNGDIIVSNNVRREKSYLPNKKNINWVDFDPKHIRGKGYTIGFSQTTLKHPAREFMNGKFLHYAEYLGINAISLDAHWSVDDEINNIDSLINEKVHGIIVSTHSGNLVKEAAVKARMHGIPVVVFSSGQPIGDWPFDIWASTNDWQQGRIAGYYCAISSGGHGKLCEIQGTAGSTITEGRANGIVTALEDFPDLQVVKRISTHWDREESYSLILQSLHDDSDFDVIIAHCDEQAIGAVFAVQEFNKKAGKENTVKVFSVSDAQSETFEYIRENKILLTMHYEQNGEIPLNLILQKLEGLDPPKVINLGTHLIDVYSVNMYSPDY